MLGRVFRHVESWAQEPFYVAAPAVRRSIENKVEENGIEGKPNREEPVGSIRR